MSQIYKKTITTTIEVDMIKCDKCEYETRFINAIDCWCIIDKENYCLECQKTYKVGFFEKKQK